MRRNEHQNKQHINLHTSSNPQPSHKGRPDSKHSQNHNTHGGRPGGRDGCIFCHGSSRPSRPGHQ